MQQIHIYAIGDRNQNSSTKVEYCPIHPFYLKLSSVSTILLTMTEDNEIVLGNFSRRDIGSALAKTSPSNTFLNLHLLKKTSSKSQEAFGCGDHL